MGVRCFKMAHFPLAYALWSVAGGRGGSGIEYLGSAETVLLPQSCMEDSLYVSLIRSKARDWLIGKPLESSALIADQ